MTDLRVEYLEFHMEVDRTVVRFECAPAVIHRSESFELSLDGERAIAKMNARFGSAEDARQCVEPFLRACEILWSLPYERPAVTFTFVDAHVVDVSPESSSPGVFRASVTCMVGGATVRASGVVVPPSRTTYPDPPAAFVASADAETMWFRFQQHVDGREPIASMGYFCLSVLQWRTRSARGRAFSAAEMFRIDRDVLDRLGVLTSERGSAMEARKLDNDATLTPLTDAEQKWIRSAVKQLIRRIGEYDYAPTRADTLPLVTMDDLAGRGEVRR